MTEARRSRLEIYAEILDKARGGALKTELVYRVNSNFRWLEQALIILLNAGLLARHGRKYHSTEQGLNWLRLYQQLAEMLP